MKFLYILLVPVMAFARPLIFDACNWAQSCYTITTPDAKSWEWRADYTGARFIRVYLHNGILDIPSNNLTVKLRR